MKNLKIFGLNGSSAYAKQVAHHLDVKLENHTEKFFDDDESYIRSDVNVRDCDVYVIAGLFSDEKQRINEKLVNLLMFIGSLRDASARRVTAIIPYFGYSRQDRKTKSREPITTKYMAKLFESVGVDRLLTIDVHSLAAFQNAFRIPVDNLDTVRLFVDYLCGIDSDGIVVDKFCDDPLYKNSKDLVVLSPDIGGMHRCGVMQEALEKRLGVEIPLAIFDKRRVNGEVTGSRIIGDVKNKRVLLFDDMIASGSTGEKAICAVEKAGGTLFAFCAVHGLFIGEPAKTLAKVNRLIVADTVPPWRLNMKDWVGRINVLSTTRLVAQAIRRTHEEGGSISDLLMTDSVSK
jgi:ribose-phosphate pyrophosphokinase